MYRILLIWGLEYSGIKALNHPVEVSSIPWMGSIMQLHEKFQTFHSIAGDPITQRNALLLTTNAKEHEHEGHFSLSLGLHRWSIKATHSIIVSPFDKVSI